MVREDWDLDVKVGEQKLSVIQVFDGKKGWTKMMGFVSPLDGKMIHMLVHDKYIDDFFMHWKSDGFSLKYRAEGEVDNKPCHVIDVYPALGTQTSRYFFDKKTKLLTKKQWRSESPQGPVRNEIFFLEWRKVKDLKDAEKGAWFDEGIEAINSLDQNTANTILSFLLTYITTEVKVGLGLLDTEGDPGELKIFDKIDEIYEEAAAGCYFCSGSVDPNEDEYGPDTTVCPMCVLKLANYTQALGINPQKVFKHIAPRRVQQARIKL